MSKNQRLIVLDTETTGLDPKTGDRIVEIGAVELLNDLPTGRKLHIYVNPERDVPQEAVKVHGLTNEFLDDKPVFAHIADDFISFVGDAQMVIHNAKFDIEFIDEELRKIGKPAYGIARTIDTFTLAKRKFPGSPASLDALCRRFNVSLEKRELHGALLDSELLSEVWLGLNGGRQPEMMLASSEASNQSAGRVVQFSAKPRPHQLPSRLTDAQVQAHSAVMSAIEASARKSSKGEFGAIWPAETDETPHLS